MTRIRLRAITLFTTDETERTEGLDPQLPEARFEWHKWLDGTRRVSLRFVRCAHCAQAFGRAEWVFVDDFRSAEALGFLISSSEVGLQNAVAALAKAPTNSKIRDRKVKSPTQAKPACVGTRQSSTGISFSMVLRRVSRFACGIFLCVSACGLRASLRQRGNEFSFAFPSVETLGFLVTSREGGLGRLLS